MGRLAILLLTMLLSCSLLLVTSQHRARKVFIELERAQSQSRMYDVRWNELELEQTRLARHALIDAVARRDLRMQPLTPERSIYLPASTKESR